MAWDDQVLKKEQHKIGSRLAAEQVTCMCKHMITKQGVGTEEKPAGSVCREVVCKLLILWHPGNYGPHAFGLASCHSAVHMHLSRVPDNLAFIFPIISLPHYCTSTSESVAHVYSLHRT